jgi:hypothetical protein
MWAALYHNFSNPLKICTFEYNNGKHMPLNILKISTIIKCPHWAHLLISSWFFTGLFSVGRSRDSSVGIATSYGLDDRGVGVKVPVGSKIFSSPNRPDQL